MELVIVGAHHEQMPLALREQVALTAAELPLALNAMIASAAEGFILSTCNRTEIVAVVDHVSTAVEAFTAMLATNAVTIPAMLAPHLRIQVGAAAVERLLTIAAGLDSMVLGEDQILAQLKNALDAADTAGTLGPILHRLGAAALTTGKRARTETSLGHGNLSVVSVALREAQHVLGGLHGRRILIIGAGDTGELALKHLLKNRRTQSASITITNRTAARANALAEHYGVHTLPWEARATALADADLVLSCTAAPDPVIHEAEVVASMAARPERPLVCLDLAVPRDIAAGVGALPGVTLRDVDALAPICAAARAQRQGAIAAARAIVVEEAERFAHWWRARAVAPTIAALREHAMTIREAEVARALDRLPDLSPREAEIVRSLATGLVNKLLHRPTIALRTSPDSTMLADAVAMLFGTAPEVLPQAPASIMPLLPPESGRCDTTGQLRRPSPDAALREADDNLAHAGTSRPTTIAQRA